LKENGLLDCKRPSIRASAANVLSPKRYWFRRGELHAKYYRAAPSAAHLTFIPISYILAIEQLWKIDYENQREVSQAC
jgi:hypothetical protein